MAKIEILAPVGSEEMLRAAVFSGADAVYLGFSGFNARTGAGNFDADSLQQAVRFCHARGVAVHVALNTTVYGTELPALEQAIRAVAASGADAVICQDLAVATLIGKIAPQLPRHGSTQMSVHTLQGALELKELGFTREITPEYHCVKEAVFPWGRFPGIDVVLGPEMKSTGEVMGIDPDPDIAFAKSQISAFNPLPTEGKVFISVNDRDKERVLHMARQLADMGFTLCATRGTMIHLLQHDIECERAYKVNEARRPNIVDHIKNGDIDFIINTPGSHDARADDIIIRSSAIAAKTSYCTNLASAQACVNAIEALKNRNLQVCTIQEYHAQTV